LATLLGLERVHAAGARHKGWKSTLLAVSVHISLVLLELLAICSPVVDIATPRAALAFALAASAASALDISSFAFSFALVSLPSFALALSLAAGAEPVQLILQMSLPFEPFGSRVIPIFAILILILCLGFCLPLGLLTG
jgi:hypothetical protein